MAKPTTTRVFRSIRHLDGCSNASQSVPCFTHPGGTCWATNALGTVVDVCDEPASVMAVRSIDEDGTDAYVNLGAEDFNLSLTAEQARRLAALLIAGADLIELNRADDTAVHAAWVAR